METGRLPDEGVRGRVKQEEKASVDLQNVQHSVDPQIERFPKCPTGDEQRVKDDD